MILGCLIRFGLFAKTRTPSIRFSGLQQGEASARLRLGFDEVSARLQRGFSDVSVRLQRGFGDASVRLLAK